MKPVQLFKGFFGGSLAGGADAESAARARNDLDIKQIVVKGIPAFRKTLAEAKRRSGRTDFPWYPYDSLSNFHLLHTFLRGPARNVLSLAGSDPILDVGCADGEVAFFLESLGCTVEAIDFPPTSNNGMRGARTLKTVLGSAVEFHEIDLDSYFVMPRERYGLALLFGILYHLKNPFYVLETISKCARYCLLSTRVARVTPDKRTNFEKLPMAYLLDAHEANGDATNYWIFSEAGLRRILARSGWEVEGYTTTGQTENSDPSHSDADERAFCLLRSRSFV